VIILPGSIIISPEAVKVLARAQWNPLDLMLKQHAEAHFAGGRGTTICDDEGTVSAFVLQVAEETMAFVVSTAKESMITTVHLKGEVQNMM
jgi:biotin carboxylase